jgi:hypothetical protein
VTCSRSTTWARCRASVFVDGLVMIGLLLLQDNRNIHQLLETSSYAADINDFYPSQAHAAFVRSTRWRGARLLPYMDDFMFMADT